MRIGIAIIVIADLLIRGGDLSAMYSDEGWWPRRVVELFGYKTGYWSLHMISGSSFWQLSLFALHFMCALFLLFGMRTKIASLAVWLLYISLHNRNLYINQSGDDLLRMVLFWGIFLPWGSYYSIDARKVDAKPKVSLTAGLGYLLLISSVYIFTVLLKTGDEWVKDHTAVYYALSLEQLRLPILGDLIYKSEGLMKFLTVFVYCIEIAIPILILIPSKKGTTRLIAFLLLLILQIGIGTTLYVGLFFMINIVSAIGFLPPFVIDKIENKIKFLNFIGHSALLGKSKLTKTVNPVLKGIQNTICITVIVCSLSQNLSMLTWMGYEPADVVSIPMNVFRLNQHWGMFSPNILKRDGWYVHYGMDSIGRQWDMIRNEDYVDFSRPKSILAQHKNDRWRKLTENMQREDMYFLRPLYCKYLLRRWNKKHPEKKLRNLTLYYLKSETLPGYKRTETERQVYCNCDLE
jgi:hypothetical protein